MDYVTLTDVEARLGTTLYVQLTDDAGNGSADEDKVTEAAEGAEGEVNSYLGRRHRVPIDVGAHAELAAVLRSVTLDLTEYRLHARRPPVPDEARRKWEAAVAWLLRISRGEAVLPAGSEVAGNPAGGISGEAAGSPRVMSREELEDL